MSKKVEIINISNIIVNKDNARHGSLKDEKSAINWLLNTYSDRMEALSKDIISTGMIYERPLLKNSKNGKYIVYDGNRRITCLKMLSNPDYVKNEKWNKFFKKITESSPAIPKTIECDISDDLGYINNLLERRHAGGKSGIGQLGWDKIQKENHLINTGKMEDHTFSIYFETLLKEKKLIDETDKLNHSIFERFLSSNKIRELIGFRIESRKTILIKPLHEVLGTILKVHNDFKNGIGTLKTLWDKTEKNKYIEKLISDGFIKTPNDTITELPPVTTPSKPETTTPQSPIRPPRKPKKPKSPIDVDFPIEVKTNEEIKLKDIWEEIQWKLTFNEVYSLGVMIRVLIELSSDYQIKKNNNIKATEDDSLNKKVSNIAEYFKQKKRISNNEYKIISGAQQMTTSQLHSFVHSLNGHPTEADIIAIWGNYKKYIIECLTFTPTAS